ncbi:MAG: NAD-dependent epimerase/dehydratase family protein [Nitrospiraceae bacterium]|nr:MAG: NAD-dependent epimerase/dehydratase family protein [Nitrospiraceae bacterium]
MVLPLAAIIPVWLLRSLPEIMNRQKTVLITGVTGLIGSYLTMVMLKRGYKVYALARSRDNKSAVDRVSSILKFWDEDVLSRNYDSLDVLDGDVSKENIGLSKHSIDILKREVDEIFHSAAVTRFNWPLENIRKVNVGGTLNVLNLAETFRQHGILRKVNHISSAYVCGDYVGVFKEDDLDLGQGFDSTYEQSKFEAEKLVEEYRTQGLWIDILRLPLVLGESETGKTFNFQQSVYQLLHIWSMEIFDHFPVREIYFNAVSVDDCCEAIIRISSMSLPVNKNYHIFNCEKVSLERFLDISSMVIGFKKPEPTTLADFMGRHLTPAQKMLLANNIFMFNNNVMLDSSSTDKILREDGFSFIGFSEDTLPRLLKYCVKESSLKK